METKEKTIDEYINNIPEDRKSYFVKLREVISANIPKWYKETMSYGMIGYVVPHSIYPSGYKTTPSLNCPPKNRI